MNVLKAMEETVALAYARGMKTSFDDSSIDFSHIDHMSNVMKRENMSYGKLCRWLGWAQACVVASGVASLEDMKEINKRHAGEEYVR